MKVLVFAVCSLRMCTGVFWNRDKLSRIRKNGWLGKRKRKYFSFSVFLQYYVRAFTAMSGFQLPSVKLSRCAVEYI